MRKLKSLGTVLLVALWLPASSHAFLQHIGLIHQIEAHDGHAHDEISDGDHGADTEHPHEHDADNHAAADGWCIVSTGKVQVEKAFAVFPMSWLVAELARVAEASFSLQAHAGPSPPGVAPPEFLQCWQFSFRAALPVRAPSFDS